MMETRKPKRVSEFPGGGKMREKIIEATIREFSKNGLKFTMNDLAKQLGISKKTIYTVFESKQAVLVAVADYYTADLDSMRKELEDRKSVV